MGPDDMKRIELEIIALSHSVSQTQNYAIILGDVEGSRRLPIVIGGFEAQAIAVVLERMTPNRPLTHDLFKAALTNFSIEIREIIINDLIDGIFFSKLVCEREGEIYEIDSRTSDALAMAVRFSCPIYTYQFIMNNASLEMDELEGDGKKPMKSKLKTPDSFSKQSVEDLEKLLAKVLEEEDYKKAAKIRDEINKRKSV
ncbi:MAG: bifunctional nuclease domain-containing protein [Saprospiraceae bacterium]